MIERICPICGGKFIVYPSTRRVRTCSVSCGQILKWHPEMTKSLPEKFIPKISWLGKKHKKESKVKNRLAHFNGKASYCKKDGYVYVWVPDHSSARWGRVPEHILIAEKALDKRLPPKVVVHHVNGNPADNRSQNLVICENQSYHRLLHTRAKKLKAREILGVRIFEKEGMRHR